MSHEFLNKRVCFNCDEKGCHRNYESSEFKFKEAWAEAKEHGWVATCMYEKGISKWMHLCPTHAEGT